jgi:hypothetical protein
MFEKFGFHLAIGSAGLGRGNAVMFRNNQYFSDAFRLVPDAPFTDLEMPH